MLNNATLLFDQPADGTYGGVVSGAGALIKQGAGRLTLTGANSYTGGTTISAGTLAGNTTSLQGNVLDNATLLFDQAADGTYGGVVSGAGALIKQGVGTLTLTGAHTYTGGTIVDAGTLLVNGAIGAVTVAPGAGLGGTGRIGMAVVNGTLSPGTSIGTISTGSLTLNGTYRVEINAAGEGDRTNVMGTVMLGPTSLLDVLAAPGGYGPSTSYVLIANDGADPVMGSFGVVSVNINSPFLVATIDYAGNDGNDVVLLLGRSSVSFETVADTPSQAAVAAGLTALEPTATGDLATVIGQLVTLTAPEARSAMDALSGDLLATLDGLDPMGTFVGTMLAASAPGPWGVGLGGATRVDSDGNAAGYRSRLAGVALGLNLRLAETWTAGLGIGYGHSDVTSNRGEAVIESLWVAARGLWEPRPFRVQAIAGYGHDDVDSDRRIRFGLLDRTARADFEYNRIQGALDAGYLLTTGAVRLEPFGRVRVTRWWRGRYQETGADSIGLIVDSNSGTSVVSTLGVRGGWASGIWSIDAHLAWQALLAGRDFTTRARFIGAPDLRFDVTGITIPRDSVVSGLRLGVGPFQVAYEVAAAPGGALSHSATGGVEFRW